MNRKAKGIIFQILKLNFNVCTDGFYYFPLSGMYQSHF